MEVPLDPLGLMEVAATTVSPVQVSRLQGQEEEEGHSSPDQGAAHPVEEEEEEAFSPVEDLAVQVTVTHII